MSISDEEARKIIEARESQFNLAKEMGEEQSLPTSTVPPPKPKEKKRWRRESLGSLKRNQEGYSDSSLTLESRLIWQKL